MSLIRTLINFGKEVSFDKIRWKLKQNLSVHKLTLYKWLYNDSSITIGLWKSTSVGDIIATQSVAKSLKQIFPHSTISFICPDNITCLGIAKRIKSFDVTIVDELANDYLQIYKKYNNEFDLLLFPNYSGIFRGIKSAVHLIPALHSSIGIEVTGKIDLEYTLTDDEIALASDYKNRLGDYMVFHTDTNSFKGRKEWLETYWQELIESQTLPVIVVGNGGPSYKGCIDMRGKLSIHQTGALINFCRLFVGVVSGPFWFTAVFNKTAVVINGGFEPPVLTQHAKSHHFYSDIECSPCLETISRCPHDMICMKMITPQMVNEKIDELLH